MSAGEHQASKLMLVLPLSALLFVGGGCGDLWNEYVLGERPWERQTPRYSAPDEPPKETAKVEPAPPPEDEAPRRAPTQAYSDLAKKTPDEIRAIKPLIIPVLTLGAHVFPFPDDQFTRAAPDKCEAWHYHGSKGFTLDLRTVPEPEDPCGFGSNVSELEVDAEALIAWFQKGPKAQR